MMMMRVGEGEGRRRLHGCSEWKEKEEQVLLLRLLVVVVPVCRGVCGD